MLRMRRCPSGPAWPCFRSVLSQLSPWTDFGNLAAIRAALHTQLLLAQIMDQFGLPKGREHHPIGHSSHKNTYRYALLLLLPAPACRQGVREGNYAEEVLARDAGGRPYLLDPGAAFDAATTSRAAFTPDGKPGQTATSHWAGGGMRPAQPSLGGSHTSCGCSNSAAIDITAPAPTPSRQERRGAGGRGAPPGHSAEILQVWAQPGDAGRQDCLLRIQHPAGLW